ncbi:MAG: DNA-binding protein [Candidatus Marsarchaeota archaeon]|nr:DNA-binding protein [Candidatus Marsarchaeota archaeon]MCL5413191.1 DNA-binding protein [Candidatus Marsarchaeota archaeon]
MAEPQEHEGNREKKMMEKRYRALQIEQQKRMLIKRLVTPEAYERLMNVRIANYELYSQLVDMLISMSQQGRIGAAITEDNIKQILLKLTPKKESNITFQHK